MVLKEGAGLPETIAQMESNILKFFQPWYKLNLRIVGLSLLAMSVGERSINLAVAKRSSAYCKLLFSREWGSVDWRA
jgi:hypothetical protein